MDRLPPGLARQRLKRPGEHGQIPKRAPDMFDITLFGAEPRPNYDRIMLSPPLAGDKSFEQIVINSLDRYAANRIELIAGEPVAETNRAANLVIRANGTIRHYDILPLATESNPIAPRLPGVNRQGVMTFRSAADVETMLELAGPGKSAS